MTEQLTLLGDTSGPALTDRQAFALELIERLDGVPEDELGAHMHARRGKHDAGERCEWCAAEGRSVATELRKKGLAIRRRSGLWESVRPRRPLEGAGEPGGQSDPHGAPPAKSAMAGSGFSPAPSSEPDDRWPGEPDTGPDGDDGSLGAWIEAGCP